MTLPTAEDLDRVILYGDIFIKDKKIHLNFELWIEEDEGLIIPKVWFQILKVPKKLQELPVLWALGSMVGAPQLLDMVASHKNPFCRVLVSVLNSKNLPQKLSVVIGDRWIEFPIRVESIVPEVESYVETSTDQGDKDGNNGADDMTDGDDRLGGPK